MQSRNQGCDRVGRFILLVSDILIFLTDHVLIWYEYVGNYSWVKKYSGRRSVNTGGKDKDQFTCQISIGKGGMKCIPYVIF